MCPEQSVTYVSNRSELRSNTEPTPNRVPPVPDGGLRPACLVKLHVEDSVRFAV